MHFLIRNSSTGRIYYFFAPSYLQNVLFSCGDTLEQACFTYFGHSESILSVLPAKNVLKAYLGSHSASFVADSIGLCFVKERSRSLTPRGGASSGVAPDGGM